MATPDEIKLQKGTIAPTQKEQTGSAKAVSLIESLAAGTPSLPKGTTISPQLQQTATQELLGQPGQAPVTVTAQTPGTGLSAAVPTTAAAPTIAGPGALTAATTTAPTAQTAATNDSTASYWFKYSYNNCCNRNCKSTYASSTRYYYI